MIKSCLKILLVFLFIFVFSATKINASEGTIELESITSEDYRCYAVSIQMMDWKYNILVTCRNLIYPAGDNIFRYVAWADPLEGNKPIKLGELGLGRASFNTKTPFSSIFVTTEVNQRAQEPEGPTVMMGNVERINFLDEPRPGEIIDVGGEEEQEKTPTQAVKTPTPNQQPSRSLDSNRLVTGLRRAGIVIGISLIVIVGIIFVLTQMRR
ncbi:hypothetical protein JXA63_01960 [Candidatus Woesebacteria bacterium]|nr:hypothetical protein [Candidatus Woesebacteria bacterium]